MTQSVCSIGVDLGGQSAKLAVVDSAGCIHGRRQVPVEGSFSSARMTKLLNDEVGALFAEAVSDGLTPGAVGVVMPGYMDRDRTRLIFAANLPGLNGTTFLADLAEALPLPVEYDADCNAAALAEYCFGAGRGIDRLIVAAVGTGIGAGVVIDGEILRVREHIAGSLGHVIINARGPKCPCGAHGCVEALASGRAMERRAAELANAQPSSRLAKLRTEQGRLTGVEIGLALAQGDQAARQVVAECGWWLGAGVAAWAPIYAPHKVLIAGGVALLGEPLLAAVRQGMQEVGQPHLVKDIVIEAAELGPDAGVIGAAAMVLPD